MPLSIKTSINACNLLLTVFFTIIGSAVAIYFMLNAPSGDILTYAITGFNLLYLLTILVATVGGNQIWTLLVQYLTITYYVIALTLVGFTSFCVVNFIIYWSDPSKKYEYIVQAVFYFLFLIIHSGVALPFINLYCVAIIRPMMKYFSYAPLTQIQEFYCQ